MAVMRAEVRAAIVEDLKAGKSQTSTAKRHKVSPSTVNGIAKAEGIGPNIRSPKNATAARKVYSQEARLELSDKLFGRVEHDLDHTGTLLLKDLALTFAVLVDKRRLEEGKATERHEFTDDDRAAIERRVDELAARRMAKGMAVGADAGASEAAAV